MKWKIMTAHFGYKCGIKKSQHIQNTPRLFPRMLFGKKTPAKEIKWVLFVWSIVINFHEVKKFEAKTYLSD